MHAQGSATAITEHIQPSDLPVPLVTLLQLQRLQFTCNMMGPDCTGYSLKAMMTVGGGYILSASHRTGVHFSRVYNLTNMYIFCDMYVAAASMGSIAVYSYVC